MHSSVNQKQASVNREAMVDRLLFEQKFICSSNLELGCRCPVFQVLFCSSIWVVEMIYVPLLEVIDLPQVTTLP